ncbi:MAG: hypothetical protein JJW01_02900 [Alphaproteobacteria bacterium]|nr:hypothetical protein [Rickettsiales bacterium]
MQNKKNIDDILKKIEPTLTKVDSESFWSNHSKEDVWLRGELSFRSNAIEVSGRESFFKLRNRYSWCIIGWITMIIVFHILIVPLIGLGVFNFKDYPSFLNTIMVEDLMQIFGMGFVVVKFLFTNQPNDVNNKIEIKKQQINCK